MPDAPGASAVIDRYLPFPLPIPVPVKLGGLLSVAATFVDLNYGAIATGLTLVGGAATLVYWNFASKRTEATKAAEAAKLQAYRDSEAAKLEVYRASEAAKLQVQREAELNRIEIQKQQDEANKGSISAQMAALSAQLVAIQHSSDEANRSLEDAREVNELMRGRLEDANEKLHNIVNEANAKNLQHEAEKRELQEAKDKLTAQLDEIQRSTNQVSHAVASQLTPMAPRIADNSARLDATAIRLDKLDGGS